jgi:hypothetical protein
MSILGVLYDVLVGAVVTYLALRLIPRITKGVFARIASRLSPRTQDRIARVRVGDFVFVVLAVACAVAFPVLELQRANEYYHAVESVREQILAGTAPTGSEQQVQFETLNHRKTVAFVVMLGVMSAAISAAWLVPKKWTLHDAGSTLSRLWRAPKALDNFLTRWSEGPRGTS